MRRYLTDFLELEVVSSCAILEARCKQTIVSVQLLRNYFLDQTLSHLLC